MSTSVIIDANIGIWAVVQGSGHSPIAIQDWLASLDKIIVPGLWIYEVTSVLHRYRLRGWPPAEIDQALTHILAIPDEVVPADRPLALSAYEWALRLEQGAAYDAFYISLAERLDAEFWTGDKRLFNRAREVGATFVRLLGKEKEA
nr:type II toxin-antitoxin system VapC family toxin [Ardenticatena sp.]